MARFSGAVGYAEMVKTAPGVSREHFTERPAKGTLVRNSRRLETPGKVNADVSLTNTVSILADEHAQEHFHAIRYVRWMGKCWKVEEATVEHPRLLLRLGGIYNVESNQISVTP